jgi:integrase
MGSDVRFWPKADIPTEPRNVRFQGQSGQWCDEAGLPNCTAHGLRKAGAVIAANNGATVHQLQAVFGWSSLAMAEHYTRSADQVRLADAAMHLLDRK